MSVVGPEPTPVPPSTGAEAPKAEALTLAAASVAATAISKATATSAPLSEHFVSADAFRSLLAAVPKDIKAVGNDTNLQWNIGSGTLLPTVETRTRATAVGPSMEATVTTAVPSQKIRETYTEVRELGSGANCTAYTAINSRGETVVLKMPSLTEIPGLPAFTVGGASLVKEAQVGLLLKSLYPSGTDASRILVPDSFSIDPSYAFSAGHKESSLYAVYPLATGGELAKVIERDHAGDLPEAERYGQDILVGLAQLHAAGIVHQDLKAENVLLDSKGRALVADFGEATIPGQAAVPSGSGNVHGPEYLKGTEAVSVKSDMWAAGRLLGQLMFGQAFIEGMDTFQNDLAEKYHKGEIKEAAYLALIQGAIEASPGFKSHAAFSPLVLSMLSPEPGSRPSAIEAHSRWESLTHARVSDVAARHISPSITV